jgi:heme/copper-type cytochrome/quinol oxidase subunit 2
MTPTRKIAAAIGMAVGAAVGAIAVHASTDTTATLIRINAARFHFEPDHIVLHKGQPVTLQLTSTDTTHGFMIRALKIDTEIKPGKVTALTVTPAAAGDFTAICDHYCGLGHGAMKLKVEIEP